MEKVKKGRKSKYDTHVAPRLQEIEWWCREGLTEIEICKRLDVAESTFNNYKREFSELMESLKKGKEIADYRVEDALYKRAIGYEYEEETRQLTESGGFTTTKIVTKHVSPDTGAIALWLKNRKRDSWQNANTFDERLKQEQIKKAKAEASILENAASKVGFKGIAKKVVIFVIVGVAHGIDIILGDKNMFRDATIFFYLANEVISILENAAKMEVLVPIKLQEAIKHFLKLSGEKEKTEDDKNG